MLNYRMITGPTVEPITLDVAKQHLRVDFSDDDALISALITAAREYCENYTHRAFFTQTWQLSLDYFPFWSPSGTIDTRSHASFPLYDAYYSQIAIRLPRPLLTSVQSITYIDTQNQQQTLPAEDYFVDVNSEPGRIVPAATTYWPYTSMYLPGSVKVTYTAASFGDGVTINVMPVGITQAMLLMIGHLYANREASSDKAMTTIPLGVACLLDPYRFQYFSYSGN